MIGTRTPFRISFAGGDSDLRSFYCRQPGCVLSTSINKYMYIMIHPFFDRRIQVKYSKTELVNSIAHIQHPIVRVALDQFRLEGVDINSIADIPAGTGLGSSCWPNSKTISKSNAIRAKQTRWRGWRNWRDDFGKVSLTATLTTWDQSSTRTGN
jgi:D-glycero-alpha-D-manno-heptose-7-phosphate kinase